jgi:SAM-dependent methyltransferase
MSFDPASVRAFEHAGWERAARAYPASFARVTTQFIPALLDAASVGPGLRVLDIACGPGYAAATAAGRGASARGLDFSPAMLAVAREAHPGIVFDEGDAEALPYADGAFDAVVSNFGIHHVPRPAVALAEAHRVLAPGGHFAFTIWAEQAENIAWKLIFDAVRRHGDVGAAKAPPPQGGFSRPEDCLGVLADAGFSETGAEIVRLRWLHADARGLIQALRQGTARMAAMIDAQNPAAMAAIVADVAESTERYREGAGIAVPVAAVIGSGRKR